MAWIEADKNYYKSQTGSELVNADDCTIEKQDKKNGRNHHIKPLINGKKQVER